VYKYLGLWEGTDAFDSESSSFSDHTLIRRRRTSKEQNRCVGPEGSPRNDHRSMEGGVSSHFDDPVT